jgi:hypothetical protein
MGYESLWFAREHYLEDKSRSANKSLQMMWHTSDDKGIKWQRHVQDFEFFGFWGPPR